MWEGCPQGHGHLTSGYTAEGKVSPSLSEGWSPMSPPFPLHGVGGDPSLVLRRLHPGRLRSPHPFALHTGESLNVLKEQGLLEPSSKH